MDGFIRFGSSVFGGVRLDGTPADQWIGNAATARYSPLIVPPLRYPRDLPQFNAEWVRRMLSDSAVQLALAARKAPLLSVEFVYREQGRWMPGVRASDPAIGDFVLRQLQRLWKRGIARLLDSAQIWGWGAGEITFRRTRDAQIEVDQILVRDRQDVRPVVQEGTIIGVEFRRLQKMGNSDRHPDKLALAFPRAIWHAHHPQSGQWFGWTVLAAAFSPWWDKHGSGGALDVRRLFMTKDGYRGTRIYYPSGTSTVQQPDGSIKQIPNQEIAMQIVETIRTGGVFALPSEVDANGTPRWKVEESQVSNNPSHILQYPKELDAEILNAMGIADDVLKSEATGSWAGKAVPQQATYCILEQWLSDLICDVDRVIEKLVEINFGPGHQYEITTRPLADQMLAQHNGPAQAANAPALSDPSHARGNRAVQPGAMLRMAWAPSQPRAPIGGVQINGKFFRGGQFIPLDDFEKASEGERQVYEQLHTQEAARYGKPGGTIGPPIAEQSEPTGEVTAGENSSSPESDDQAQEQSAQDAPTSPSDEELQRNANAADKTLTDSEPTEQPPPKERTPEERREELRNYLFRIIDGDLTEEEKAELGDEFTAGFGEGFVDELNEILDYLQVVAELPRVSMDKTVADAAAKADALLWLTKRLVLDEESQKRNISITNFPIPDFLRRHIVGARERNQQDMAAVSQFLGNAFEETHKIVETLRSSPKFNRQASDILQALGQDKIARSYFNSAFSQQTTLANRGQSMEKTREDLKHLVGKVLEHSDDEMLSAFEAARAGGPRLAGQVTGMIAWEALKGATTSVATAGTGTGLAAAFGARKAGKILDKIKDAKKVTDAAPDAPKGTWVKPPGCRLPKNGEWDGTPGHSNFKPDNPMELGLKPNEVIPFREGRPDFSKWSKGNYTSKQPLTGDHDTDGTKMLAALREEKGWTRKQTEDWLRGNRYVLHHAGGDTFQIIESRRHGANAWNENGVRHTGGAYDRRNQ